MIRGFWACGTDCIVDVWITDLDSKSYIKRSSDVVGKFVHIEQDVLHREMLRPNVQFP
jgi:hypothetical protein